jgi:hypothetical protein
MLNYDGPVFLILDNCSVHDGAEFHDQCRVCRIVALFIPPHSSHFVQPLDLCLFGRLKNPVEKMHQTAKCNIQMHHILRVINVFQSAAVTTTVVATFRNADLTLFDVLDGEKIPYPICGMIPLTMQCCREIATRCLCELRDTIDDGEEDEGSSFGPNPETTAEPPEERMDTRLTRVVREVRQWITQERIENELQRRLEIGVDPRGGMDERQEIRH